MMARGGVRGVLQIAFQSCHIIEFDDHGEFVVVAHHLFVSRQRMLHALSDAKTFDRRNVLRGGSQRVEERARDPLATDRVSG